MHLWQMLNELKQHWKVKNKELLLIISTFAITGITTAWPGKKVSDWLRLGYEWNILVGIKNNSFNFWVPGDYFNGWLLPGMFPFFFEHKKKILRRLGLLKKNKWSMVTCPSKKFREMI